MAADAGVAHVRPGDHDRRVPADVGPDAALEVLVAREPRLLVGRDRVDVRARDGGREADLAGSRSLEQLHEEEAGAWPPAGLDDGIEGVQPLGRLLRIGVGYLMRETIEDHPHSLAPTASPSTATARPATMRGSGRAAGRSACSCMFEDPSPATVVFTDGACIGNPGPGGWAWAVSDEEYESGHESRTTNQRMEVTAVLQALGAISGRVQRGERLDLRRQLLQSTLVGEMARARAGGTPAASRSRTRTSGVRSWTRSSTAGGARSS